MTAHDLAIWTSRAIIDRPYSAALAIGALSDLLLGDPRWLPHPIRAIGLLVSGLERLVRKLPFEKAGGCILVYLRVSNHD